jgi:hypothetical protein
MAWLSFIIQTIWQTTYDVWTTRCNRNHGTEPETKRRRALQSLVPQVATIFQARDTLPSDTSYLFHKSQDEILQLPTHALTSWVFKAKLRIQRIQRKQKQTHKQQQLHPFFSTRANTMLTKSKPRQKPITVTKRCAPKLVPSLFTYFPLLPKGTLKKKNTNPKNDLRPP